MQVKQYRALLFLVDRFSKEGDILSCLVAQKVDDIVQVRFERDAQLNRTSSRSKSSVTRHAAYVCMAQIEIGFIERFEWIGNELTHQLSLKKTRSMSRRERDRWGKGLLWPERLFSCRSSSKYCV